MREAASTTKKGATTTTALAALGIVFGDLGTSPLYTYQTIVSDVGGRPSVGDALGLLSLVVWTLIVTISIKSCILVMPGRQSRRGRYPSAHVSRCRSRRPCRPRTRCRGAVWGRPNL